uniref:Isoprenylcysteine carboxylmethyltransferase family protein n=1 Tax=Thermofilum pendens TaxID=2269 RepID=A0A7J3X4Y1_THEPE
MYARVRHPHYSSTILLVLGAALLPQSLPALLFAILNVVILYRAAKEEEEHLLETHGAAYEEYMKKVRWRSIPWVIWQKPQQPTRAWVLTALGAGLAACAAQGISYLFEVVELLEAS